MSGQGRTWQAVCADCDHYSTAMCAFSEAPPEPDDCIAAVCDRFTPASEHENDI